MFGNLPNRDHGVSVVYKRNGFGIWKKLASGGFGVVSDVVAKLPGAAKAFRRERDASGIRGQKVLVSRLTLDFVSAPRTIPRSRLNRDQRRLPNCSLQLPPHDVQPAEQRVSEHEF